MYNSVVGWSLINHENRCGWVGSWMNIDDVEDNVEEIEMN